jgi:hypothetical protein
MSQKVYEPSALGVRKSQVNLFETWNVSHGLVRSSVPSETVIDLIGDI